MDQPEQWVSVARVVRPQGRHGEVLAEIRTDFPERFATMRRVFLARGEAREPVPIAIEKSWLHKGRIVLKLATVDSISAAEGLRGAELVIPATERMALGPDAVYIGDLIGCSVIDVHRPDRTIGTVRDVLRQEATTDLLLVRGIDDVEHSIPFAKAFVVRLDLSGRRLEMDLPDGLLEVNAPLSEEERRSRSSET